MLGNMYTMSEYAANGQSEPFLGGVMLKEENGMIFGNSLQHFQKRKYMNDESSQCYQGFVLSI